MSNKLPKHKIPDPRPGMIYKVTGTLEKEFERYFRSKAGAKRYLDAIESKLTEANKLADGFIWTSIELIYETRWDYPTARLAAAIAHPSPN